MEEVANEFWRKNRGKGRITKITNYCFWWETLPDKNENIKTTVYMASYFLKL